MANKSIADSVHETATLIREGSKQIKFACEDCECRVLKERDVLDYKENGTVTYSQYVPADWETKRPFGMTTLSSEFLAQSTMPLRPFMGKLMSVITDTAGSLWMLATAAFKHTDRAKNIDFQYTSVFMSM